MKLQVWRSTVRVLGALVAALCVIWACSTPTKVGVEAKWGDVSVGVTIDSAGNSVTTATGSLAPGKCLRVTYSDSTGNTLGSNVISVPGYSQVPAGAVRQEFEIVDCPEPPALTWPSTLPSISHRAHALPKWREVFSMPLTVASPSGTLQRGVLCHARVFCLPTQDPIQLLQPILSAGAGIAVPATVDVLFMAEITGGTTDAQLRVAARSPILDMSFDWNGVQGFGNLASGTNAVPSSLPNGWHVVDATIPGQTFHPNLGDWNGGQVRIRTLARPAFSEYAQSFQSLAF